jgi:uncharacterized protein YjbI with pentapeptide repeats
MNNINLWTQNLINNRGSNDSFYEHFVDQNFSGVDFKGQEYKNNLKKVPFNGVMMCNTNLADAIFNNFNFGLLNDNYSILSNCVLDNTVFYNCDLEKISICGDPNGNFQIEGAIFKRCNMKNARISYVKQLKNCTFENCNLDFGSIFKSNLSNCKFINCKMYKFDARIGDFVSIYIEGSDCNEGGFSTLNIESTMFRNCNLEQFSAFGCKFIDKAPLFVGCRNQDKTRIWSCEVIQKAKSIVGVN